METTILCVANARENAVMRDCEVLATRSGVIIRASARVVVPLVPIVYISRQSVDGDDSTCNGLKNEWEGSVDDGGE
ncbi:hypothetical protein PsorP6_012121 [Peronosclerospora sorghi]|uniref:Uncharacterized protein n=1 Tax=Peronosclerospora sorghi TaxID=230839 RepID=A0ACC0WKB1_9STRA|nr:hypothetical protein PsorP6_012121 [Peronosclerospora sorghi]